ncbi:hypothetical protein SAMN05216410_1728 [Sanguibacter gelidistatuariae]|uniref:Uncharacterized protein n=1 Tax=Sanguibacter gelidistatuariae TaxID=1814289 RepID=A0A1G6KZC7_9MICO|nr:hypothetical protein [Sanguibacter gelidistatuariae]SDC36430.1 hypothetical protein SAMN05216410_1728 [Sanguibacter gelidistatuariae]
MRASPRSRPAATGGPAVALVAVALVLTACSSADTPGTPAIATSTEHRGPLLEYLAPTMSDEQTAADDAVYQEDVASCMAEAGFDYIPFVAPPFVVAPVSDAGTLDWVARHGYRLSGGAMGTPEAQAWAAAEANIPDYVDPNAAPHAQLSPGTRAAYDLALDGPENRNQVTIDVNGSPLPSPTWTKEDGCSSWAIEQADRRTRDDLSEFTDLLERMDAAWQTLDSQPQIIDLTAEWAHCMADAGHAYTSPEDAWASVYAVIHGDPGAGGNLYATSEELKAFEITVALADYDCQASLNWDAMRNTVRDEVEAQFLADNKAEIDEYIAAVESMLE